MLRQGSSGRSVASLLEIIFILKAFIIKPITNSMQQKVELENEKCILTKAERIHTVLLAVMFTGTMVAKVSINLQALS